MTCALFEVFSNFFKRLTVMTVTSCTYPKEEGNNDRRRIWNWFSIMFKSISMQMIMKERKTLFFIAALVIVNHKSSTTNNRTYFPLPFYHLSISSDCVSRFIFITIRTRSNFSITTAWSWYNWICWCHLTCRIVFIPQSILQEVVNVVWRFRG